MIFQKLHQKLGDFWWYSILLFVALRIGDVINAFAGLWLIPHYVPQEELGAVPALLQASMLFGLPMLILVFTFTKFLNQYATCGEQGKVKAILQGFGILAIVFSVISTIAAYYILPHFFERIRIVSGSLGILIVVSGTLMTLSPIFTNALQALKKFNALTIMNILSAPIRLLVLLFALPIRALSGYLVGQATPPLFLILASCFCLRKELKHEIPVQSFWKEDGRKILKFTGMVAIWLGVGTVCTGLQMMVIRQRLPEVESAAYYMISRLAEIGSYLGLTLTYVMFPLAAEAHTKGEKSGRLLRNLILGTFLTGAACTILFAILGPWLFKTIPLWRPYQEYQTQLVLLTATVVLRMTSSNFYNYEVAYNRFSFLWYMIPIAVIEAGVMVCFSGYTFFYGILPDSIVNWMGSCEMARLSIVIWVMFVCSLVAIAANAIQVFFARSTFSNRFSDPRR